MAEEFNARSVLDLLFYDYIELSDCDVSEEEEGGYASCFIDRPLDASELFSLSEFVSETPVGTSFCFFAVQALSVLLRILQSWMVSGTARVVSYLAGKHYLFV